MGLAEHFWWSWCWGGGVEVGLVVSQGINIALNAIPGHLGQVGASLGFSMGWRRSFKDRNLQEAYTGEGIGRYVDISVFINSKFEWMVV